MLNNNIKRGDVVKESIMIVIVMHITEYSHTMDHSIKIK
jgi:hypothetical protein